MRSLALRITAWYVVSTLALLAGVTGYLYLTLKTRLQHEANQVVADEIEILRLVFERHPGDFGAVVHEVELESEARVYEALHKRVLDARGNVLTSSHSFPRLPPQAYPAPAAPGEKPSCRSYVSASGTPYQIGVSREVVGASPPQVRIIQMVLDYSQRREVVWTFRNRAFALLGLSSVLSTLIGYGIARRGIRPVQRIADAARRIGPTHLDERIDMTELSSEILVVADRFNEMLDRLRDSFQRLDRFSSNIAHELRTPLSNLRGEIEVVLAKARSVEEYRSKLDSCLEEVVRLARLVDQLLFLARAENPQAAVPREAVDIGRELAALAEYYEAAAEEAGLRIVLDSPPGMIVSLNREMFQRAIANLIDNALAHTPAGGTIRLSARRDPGRLRVEVADTGCGIAAEHLPRVFDRLYRAEDADRARSGMGLGLSMVKTIAELHGGEATIESEEGGGTRVTLTVACP